MVLVLKEFNIIDSTRLYISLMARKLVTTNVVMYSQLVGGIGREQKEKNKIEFQVIYR